MGFTEFVVFIARISREISFKSNELHLKIDKLLGLLFNTIKAKKTFTFEIKEEGAVSLRAKSKMRSILMGVRFIGKIQKKIKMRRVTKSVLNAITAINYMKKLVEKR